MKNNIFNIIDGCDNHFKSNNSSNTKVGGLKDLDIILGIRIFLGILTFLFQKRIDVSGKILTDNNKTNNKLKEIEAKSEADCRKIETQGEVKCKIIDKETEGKCKIIRAQGVEKRETMKLEHELDKDLFIYKQAYKEQQKQAKQQQTTPGLDEWLQQYRQDIPQADAGREEVCTLIFPWLTEGYDIGLVAPTNCGKTTLMMQIAMDLSRGECTYKLAPGCSKIQPVRTLYFALEQSRKDIDRHYGSAQKGNSMLTVYDATVWNTAAMLDIIKREMMACRGRGVVVIIDNWTKLLQKNNQTAADRFWNDLDDLRMASSQTANPLTTIKVFHTKKSYKTDRKIIETDCRENGKYLTSIQNVLTLTYSSRGTDYRVQGYIKLKDGDSTELNLLRYANTNPYQYEYVEAASPDDLGRITATILPDEAQSIGKTSPKQVEKKKGPGRPASFTLEQAIECWNEVKSCKSTWKQIEEKTGFKRAALKKRARPYMSQGR